jgi:hypothetical protein
MGCGMLTGVGLLQPRWFFGLSYATYRIIRNETLIEKDIWRFLSIVFDLERTNQLSLLPDKDLVDLCSPIEPDQVTKSLFFKHTYSPANRRTSLTTLSVSHIP